MIEGDPFLIRGPAIVQFSGGRTSGYMLHRIIQAYDGRLPDDVLILFQNTGREMPATLDFVRDCAARFGAPVVWLEYARREGGPTYRVVDHTTASRDGAPFEALLGAKKMLPNPVARFCTSELKIRTATRYVMETRGWKRWKSVIGLRADEPRRVERATDPARCKKDRWDVVCPLAEAGVTEDDVLAFWRDQSFDLRLAGKWEGNCDGCYLKAKAALLRMHHDHPERMEWWARMEREKANNKSLEPRIMRFRKDRASYAEMALSARAASQLEIDFATMVEADPVCGMSCEPIHEH